MRNDPDQHPDDPMNWENWTPPAATEKQLELVEALRRRLHLSKPLLCGHVERTFGYPFEFLCKTHASQLIDEMKQWCELDAGVPPVIRREAGQRDLPGLES